MENHIGLTCLDHLSKEDLKGKTLFIRVDFNVPMAATRRGNYVVDDDTRIRRFLDLTFTKIHDLTDGDCRIIIGSHLGRPHVKKNHSGWDGMFNLQFVSSHFDTLIRQKYLDLYTIFPPEIIGSQLNHSLEIVSKHQLPLGGIKFLPNLRYLLDPDNTEVNRNEFIEQLGDLADVYINCAFGTNHRLSKSIKMLPQVMRRKNKLAVSGSLLIEEIKRLGEFGFRILKNPEKTAVLSGGSKVADKIGILKQFVNSKVNKILLGGKMVNAFILAKEYSGRIDALTSREIPAKLCSQNGDENLTFIKEVRLAEEILCLAEKQGVNILFPTDYKVVKEYQQTSFSLRNEPDWSSELQLDIGPNSITSFSKQLLKDDIENVFWNGPLGAYDHPFTDQYGEGSKGLIKTIFARCLIDQKFSAVIGGGDTAAILNKFEFDDIKKLIRDQIENQLSTSINKDLVNIDFQGQDCYALFNNFTSNFFVSTGGGASLEFLENFIKDDGKSSLANYLAGTAALLELSSV
jgi:phosphoglycerate kinase